MEKMSLRLPSELIEKLDEIAAAEKRTRSNVILLAVEAYILALGKKVKK